jgi:hypothetical protein
MYWILSAFFIMFLGFFLIHRENILAKVKNDADWFIARCKALETDLASLKMRVEVLEAKAAAIAVPKV